MGLLWDVFVLGFSFFWTVRKEEKGFRHYNFSLADISISAEAAKKLLGRTDKAEKQTATPPFIHSYPPHKGFEPSPAEFFPLSSPLLPSSSFHMGTSASESLCGGGVTVATSNATDPEWMAGGLGASDMFSGTTESETETSFKTKGCPRLE